MIAAKLLNKWREIIKLVLPPKPRPEIQAVSFPKLRDTVERLIELTAEVRSNLEGLHIDLNDYGAKSWAREKEVKEKYYHIVTSLFLLLDHLENLDQNEKSDLTDWLYRKIRRTLEDEGIDEIPVEKGGHFSGTYHKCVGTRTDGSPKDTILEITRKGYYTKSRIIGEDDIILRPVEVIVSQGPSEKQSKSKTSGEAGK